MLNTLPIVRFQSSLELDSESVFQSFHHGLRIVLGHLADSLVRMSVLATDFAFG